jgi:hypothetical protein
LNIRFYCPVCERPASWKSLEGRQWHCPTCDHCLDLEAAAGQSGDGCGICGNHELYKKKDFPQWLGMSILAAACLVYAVLGLGFYRYGLAWAVLIGSWLIDVGLYWWVGDALVCYRCDAVHRQVPVPSGILPFDLGVKERYRQERLRRARLSAVNKFMS